jgi:hypothetical protein
VGIDLPKRISATVLTADGKLIEHRLPNDLARLERLWAINPSSRTRRKRAPPLV